MAAAVLSDDQREELVRAARTVVVDELRSVTSFMKEPLEPLYLCSGLDQTADLLAFADNERLGFRSQTTYAGTQLKEYQFTIHVFEYGHVTRVIVGGHYVWVTTDTMQIDRFEELAAALAAVFEGSSS